MLIDASQKERLIAAASGVRAVISARRFASMRRWRASALATGCSYFDLHRRCCHHAIVRSSVADAKPWQIFMPQCGLAPGFVASSRTTWRWFENRFADA